MRRVFQESIWILGVALLLAAPALAADTWRGLVVAPEDRCSAYSKRGDYPYPQSVEARIVAGLGGRIYGPYTGRTFSSTRQTDIEHIVATSEAHDSGLCAADAAAPLRLRPPEPHPGQRTGEPRRKERKGRR